VTNIVGNPMCSHQVPQVLNVFPRAPHFVPCALPKGLPLGTYIGG